MVIIPGGGLGHAILGVILGGLTTLLGMGATSWWLIGLQRYKNEIHGPWDPARPIIRRGWD
jgi:phosphatidylinositol glycan class C protein